MAEDKPRSADDIIFSDQRAYDLFVKRVFTQNILENGREGQEAIDDSKIDSLAKRYLRFLSRKRTRKRTRIMNSIYNEITELLLKREDDV
jgi:hypothetical protein